MRNYSQTKNLNIMKTTFYSLILIALVTLGSLHAQTTTVFSENFTKFTGNDVSTTDRAQILNLDGTTTFPGWRFCSTSRQAGGALKLGQGSTLGYIVTPALDLSGGTIDVSFSGAPWAAPSSTTPASIQVAVLIDGVQVTGSPLTVTQVWSDPNHTVNSFPTYSITGIPTATSTSKITLMVGNTNYGGTLGNGIILDQFDVSVNGNSVLSESFNNFSLGYNYTWNRTWDGLSTLTSFTAPLDMYAYVVGQIDSELDQYTQQSGWTGDAIYQNGGKAVIGWERKYNAASATDPNYPGYLTTPTIELRAGDTVNFTTGVNATGTPTLQVLLGDINSTNVLITPTLTSAATQFTTIIPTTSASKITFKITNAPVSSGSLPTIDAFLSSIQITRVTTGINDVRNQNSLSVSAQSNELIISNNANITQQVSVYSLTGSKVRELLINSGSNKFEFSKGAYIIRTEYGISKKIIIP